MYLKTIKNLAIYKEIINDNKIKYYFIFSLIYILPILIANVNYADDFHRQILGYGGGNTGRYMADFVYKLLSFNNTYVFNLYPYTLIINSFIYFFAGYLISSQLKLETNRKIKLAPLIFLISPYLLENLSYRYDGLPMSLSVLFVVIPYQFLNTKIFPLLSIIFVAISLGFYQPSSFTFIILGLINLYSNDNTFTTTIKKLFTLFTLYLLGYLIYKIGLNLLDYKINYTVKDGNVFIKNFEELKHNLYLFYSFINNSMGFKYLILVIPFCILFSINFIFTINKSYFIKRVLLLFIIIIMIGGANLYIKNPVFTPRTFITFPLFFYFILFAIKNNERISKACTILTYLLIIYSLILSSNYGIYLKNNDDHLNSISNVINNQVKINDQTTIILKNRIIAPSNKLIYKSFPTIRYVANQDFGNHVKLSEYVGLKRKNYDNTMEKKNFILIYSNTNFNIKQYENLILIENTN